MVSKAKFLLLIWRFLLGKLRLLSGKEICKILQDNGFTEVRQKGSHIVMQKAIEDSTFVKLGTLMSIIRQSQLPRSLFE